ncbi:MAG: polymerase sigma-C factor [Actinomycetia bacterium]|nr:polymerase sigma-C factor [Actinomycetes bacterium]
MDELTGLLLAARDGDRASLTHAIRISQAEVWRLAAHLVSRDDADDVTQDVYIRVFRSLPSFRGESSGRTWLLSIARRSCADAVRVSMRRRARDARLRAQPVHHDALDPTEGIALDELVAGLEPDRREAFVLTQVTGCSYAEAAEICGVPIGTIRSRVARARSDLVEDLRAAGTG